MTQLFDIVKAFGSTLQSKTGLPEIDENAKPKSGATMRYMLINPDEFFQWLDSDANRITGTISIQISAPIGASKFYMLQQAALVRDAYPRSFQFAANGYVVTIEQTRTSSIYQTDSNENINVDVSFVCYCE